MDGAWNPSFSNFHLNGHLWPALYCLCAPNAPCHDTARVETLRTRCAKAMCHDNDDLPCAQRKGKWCWAQMLNIVIRMRSVCVILSTKISRPETLSRLPGHHQRKGWLCMHGSVRMTCTAHVSISVSRRLLRAEYVQCCMSVGSILGESCS